MSSLPAPPVFIGLIAVAAVGGMLVAVRFAPARRRPLATASVPEGMAAGGRDLTPYVAIAAAWVSVLIQASPTSRGAQLALAGVATTASALALLLRGSVRLRVLAGAVGLLAASGAVLEGSTSGHGGVSAVAAVTLGAGGVVYGLARLIRR